MHVFDFEILTTGESVGRGGDNTERTHGNRGEVAMIVYMFLDLLLGGPWVDGRINYVTQWVVGRDQTRPDGVVYMFLGYVLSLVQNSA